ncbi:peptidase S10 serine carboxypeptidase [Schizophyllum amplum]|uniref:Carboxypeptidase n=1 Tax=Schizophyllum amplum TaxID=97359 RepID=A0A550CUX5_9AGAR|nr:peptidase S10 serine carboxypeptidase [Auriculariopsis ampla]
MPFNKTVETRLLSSLPADDFTSLSHPHFPNHGVRVKKTSFCDPTVNAYTGYLDIDQGAKHLFFSYFESRRDPDNDDVMMWINGGPGASSMLGMLMELGPCSIDMKNESSNGTIWNPYSWNSEANIFFLDQRKVGVGFSYADFGETVETTEEAAKNVHAFITIFLETFTQLAGRPLHLSGESYGGRYLPVFASEIVDQNAVAVREGRPTINLQSVLIGNGITDISTLYAGRYEIECGRAAFDVPFQSISACVRMKTALPRCEKAMQKACIDQFDAMNCRAAVAFCDSELSTGMWATGKNVYDISKPCIGELCYEENAVISRYLNHPDTQALLGVARNFTMSSSVVSASFLAHMDKWASPTQYYVAGLLERGVRMLIYAGTYDWQCNWVSNRLWVEKLEWSGAGAYSAAAWRDWGITDDSNAAFSKAGEVRETPLLTFATVRGAGHMMSAFPAESLAMVSRWLKVKAL